MNIIKFLKEYLSLIIIIPTFLGGIWQILELSLMSISYVRFFSITQLVADGILIIIVILPWIIGLIFSVEIYNSVKNKDSIIKNNIFVDIFLYFIIILVCYISGKVLYNIIKEIGINTYIGYLFLVTYVYFILFVVIVFFSKLFIKCIHFFKKIYKTRILSFSLIVISSFFLFFHYIFFIPKNLENITNLPDGKIRYFNDKYIFIENKKNENILVVKFDKLFKEE